MTSDANVNVQCASMLLEGAMVIDTCIGYLVRVRARVRVRAMARARARVSVVVVATGARGGGACVSRLA